MLKVKNLDKRICDIEENATNTETYREFIITSEESFGIEHADLDNMKDCDLNKYILFLDYLYEK